MNINATTSTPLVSVIITCYNRAKEIQRAIGSVRWQTYGNVEVIVVDDASRDASVERISALVDPQLTLVRHSLNQGQNAAIRSGLAHCNGEYVAFLDSDDIWLPNYLEQMISAFEDDIEMTYCWMVGGIRSHLTDSNNYRDVLAQGYLSNLNTLVVRRRVLNPQECFPDLAGPLRVCQDDILCFAIAKNHKYKLVPLQLAVSLPAQNSMTNQSTDLADGLEIFLAKQEKEIIEHGGYAALARRRLSLAPLFFLARKPLRGASHSFAGALYLLLSIPEKLSRSDRNLVSRSLPILFTEIILSILRGLKRRN